MLGKHLLVKQFPEFEALSGIQVPGLQSVGDIHLDTLTFSWICMGGILGAALLLRPMLVADGPGGTAQGIAEGFYKFIDDLCHGQIGSKYKTYMPLIAAIFIFVLIANLAGIGPYAACEHIPGWFKLPSGHPFEIASPTTDLNVTAGLALLSLIVYLGAGVKQHGSHYVKLFIPIVSPMAPIEYMDLLIRPMTLALRLLLVITADELTRMVFLLILPWVAPTFVMAFEIFIAIIQAFVFALLSSIYIGMAVADHH